MAYEELQKKKMAKGLIPNPTDGEGGSVAVEEPKGQRAQPKKKKKKR